jgi:D-alanyl-D-alanine carboxypeptidase
MLAAKLPAKTPKIVDTQVADATVPQPSLVPGAKPFVPNAPVVAAEIAPTEVAVVDNRAMDQIVADVMNSPQQASADGTIDVTTSSAVLTASGAPSMIPTLKPGTSKSKQTLVAAVAPDSQATTVVWKPEGDYGIQVGAYSKYNAAQNAAQVATQAEPGLLADARIIIDSQKMNNGGKVYRARVAGLTKAAAQTACRNLKAKRTDCLVLKIDNPLAMGN